MDSEKVSVTSPPEGTALDRARKYVAGALLERCGNGSGSGSRLTVRDMVTASGTDWESVRLSLRELQAEGAIRLERHRIFIRTDLLRAAAAPPGGNALN